MQMTSDLQPSPCCPQQPLLLPLQRSCGPRKPAPWLAVASTLPGRCFVYGVLQFSEGHIYLFFVPKWEAQTISRIRFREQPERHRKTKNFLPLLSRNNLYINSFTQGFKVYTKCFGQSESERYNPVLNPSPTTITRVTESTDEHQNVTIQTGFQNWLMLQNGQI